MSPEVPAPADLAELQHQFVREILYREGPELPARILPGGVGVERRLGIYRTNARENFALALEAAFPLLLRSLGREEFRQLAWAYQRAHPSSAGNLFQVGEPLPAFLAERVSGTADAWLIDAASLEWLVQEALVAADSAVVLDLAALGAVPPERQAAIRFTLHPSVRLLRARRGVFALWQALQAGKPLPAVPPAPECLLIQRQAAGVQLQRLAGPELEWLAAVQGGATLGDAADLLPEPARDALGELLVRWVATGVIIDFQ